jgi:hypothetical protein
LRIVSALLALPGIRILPNPARTVTILMELLRRRPVTGGKVFDLQIVAAIKANNVQRIYTFNARDFQVFPELTVVVPLSRELPRMTVFLEDDPILYSRISARA